VEKNITTKLLNQNKMTAVEWFADELKQFGYHIPKIWFEAAKEMEKKQIILAHGIKMKGVNNMKCVTGEQYYNETFKSK
jgi:hypothetical protein